MRLPTTPPSSAFRSWISASVFRLSRGRRKFVASPYQFAFRPAWRARLGRIPGVHSIVWILAITAALMRRATLNRRASSQCGYFVLSRAQIALCSLTNSVCSMLVPTHQLRTKPVSSTPSLPVGSRPSASIRS